MHSSLGPPKGTGWEGVETAKLVVNNQRLGSSKSDPNSLGSEPCGAQTTSSHLLSCSVPPG